MNSSRHSRQLLAKLRSLAVGAAGLAFIAAPAQAAVSFLGVAAGDADTTSVILWTRAVDDTQPTAAIPVTLQYSTDPTFNTGVSSQGFTTTPVLPASGDGTLKVSLTGLSAATRYYYRFVGSDSTVSNVGTFKTAPAASTRVPVKFAFSGDLDGLIRPYALASQLPAEALDFYANLGDVIYENASNVGGNNAASWLNSPSVALSNDALNFNGIPRAFIPSGTPFATKAQLYADYSKKYREQFLPVNTGGQSSLKDFYAGQSNYTFYDNHELGNRKYIDGGAPAGGSVGGAAGTDMPTGRGVDARNNVGGNVGNVNDVNNSAGDYMNRAQGFLAMQDVFLNYLAIREDRAPGGFINAPLDPRSHGTAQLYFAQPWGKNAIYVQLDTRTYRDIRLKTANAGADDTSSPRADNAGRTMLGKTQLEWAKQTLLAAQKAGIPWKFIAVSDPIDQIGPIAGALTLTKLPSFGFGSTYSPVSADGGKAWIGGYRAERNALLKFIADNNILNVVFLATDDHQNRVNELTYSPTGQPGVQSSYVKVPHCFSIVAGPLGATGPDLITNHTFAMAQQLTNSITAAQNSANVETNGLIGYPGLHDVTRDGDATATTAPQAVDFYSPDTFNYNLLSVSADGKTLAVASKGIYATAQNSALEYGANGNTIKTVFSFQIDAGLPVARSGFALDRRLNKLVQTLTVTNNTASAYSGPVQVALTGLSANTALSNKTGTTATTLAGSPYITVAAGGLAAGASASVTLQFNVPVTGGITYGTQTIASVATP
jgi:phosphodiesterase/alkaline phosphatase D-like protein